MYSNCLFWYVVVSSIWETYISSVQIQDPTKKTNLEQGMIRTDRERERERKKERKGERERECVCVCVWGKFVLLARLDDKLISHNTNN